MPYVAESIFSGNVRRRCAVRTADEICQLLKRRGNARPNIENLARYAFGFDRLNDRGCHICDQNEVAPYQSVFVQWNALPATGHLTEERDDTRVGIDQRLTRPENVLQTEHDIFGPDRIRP